MVRDGDWSIVIMNVDASRDVDVSGSVDVDLPILGPIAIGTLLVGLAIVAVGVWLTVSGARTPTAPRGAAPPRPDADA
jgi:hypothetical protein